MTASGSRQRGSAPPGGEWGELRLLMAAVAAFLIGGGLVLAGPAYLDGSAAQARQDRDLARVAVNFARAGVVTVPLRIDADAADHPPAGRCIAVPHDLPARESTWSAVAAGAGRYELTDGAARVLASGRLRDRPGSFHGRGLCVGDLPNDLPAADYRFTVRVTRPTAGAGAAEVFVWDRQYEFAFLGPLLRVLPGAAAAGVGVLLVTAVTLPPVVLGAFHRVRAVAGSRADLPAAGERA